MDFYTERYGKVRQMSEKELKQHHDIIKKQNEEIENYTRLKQNENNFRNN